MINFVLRQKIYFFLPFLILPLLFVSTVFSSVRDQQLHRSVDTKSDRLLESTRSASHSGEPKDSREQGYLRSCQAKESSIKERALQLNKRAEDMINKFDSISQRVQEYYNNKVKTNGRAVSNYDSLVNDIKLKKDTVSASLSKTQQLADGFTCQGQNPKQQLTDYRTAMQDVIKALKDYRHSVRNLIVAVFSQAESSKDDNKTSTDSPKIKEGTFSGRNSEREDNAARP